MIVINKHTKNGMGFTLVELLVVVSITSTLLAVLMPSLNKVREQAKRVYCLSNMRQMTIAANTYVNSNDQHFPISQWFDDKKSYGWDYVVDNVSNKIEPGLLWQGETIDKVNQCPSYKGSNNWSATQTYTGYNYNTSYIGHGQGENTTLNYTGQVISHPLWPSFYKIVMSAKINQVRSPGTCALFGDGHYSAGANKMMRSPFIWDGDNELSLKTAGTQGYRHNNQTNVAWVDGHATSKSEFYTDSYNLITGGSIDRVKADIDSYNKTAKIKIGFLSPDNSAYDLK